MKLPTFVAIAAVIGGSFLIPNPAEAFWGGNKSKQVIGYWSCEAKAPGKIGSTGSWSLTGDKNASLMWTQNSSKEGITFKATTQVKGKYRVERNKLRIYNATSLTKNQSYISGNSYAENVQFRKEVGEDLPTFASRPWRKTNDVVFEISTVSSKHLILQPEGGGSAEIICKK